eukprot:1134599-Prorocentrum_minimum.AAC.3
MQPQTCVWCSLACVRHAFAITCALNEWCWCARAAIYLQDRAFGAASMRHKKKTGGLSNKEKEHKKNLPLAVRLRKVRPHPCELLGRVHCSAVADDRLDRSSVCLLWLSLSLTFVGWVGVCASGGGSPEEEEKYEKLEELQSREKGGGLLMMFANDVREYARASYMYDGLRDDYTETRASSDIVIVRRRAGPSNDYATSGAACSMMLIYYCCRIRPRIALRRGGGAPGVVLAASHISDYRRGRGGVRPLVPEVVTQGPPIPLPGLGYQCWPPDSQLQCKRGTG